MSDTLMAVRGNTRYYLRQTGSNANAIERGETLSIVVKEGTRPEQVLSPQDAHAALQRLGISDFRSSCESVTPCALFRPGLAPSSPPINRLLEFTDNFRTIETAAATGNWETYLRALQHQPSDGPVFMSHRALAITDVTFLATLSRRPNLQQEPTRSDFINFLGRYGWLFSRLDSDHPLCTEPRPLAPMRYGDLFNQLQTNAAIHDFSGLSETLRQIMIGLECGLIPTTIDRAALMRTLLPVILGRPLTPQEQTSLPALNQEVLLRYTEWSGMVVVDVGVTTPYRRHQYEVMFTGQAH